MITVHAYKTWQGETRGCISHSAGSLPAEHGTPGVRSTLLNEAEARSLLEQLTAGLAAPLACIDCGSSLHRTGSVFCAEANKEENE